MGTASPVTTELLEFRLDSNRYALRVGDVVEIVRAAAITRLPDAPAIVEGVIDLRGQLVPVLNLRARFGHPPRALDPSEHFIVASAGERTVAIRAEEAKSVARVDEGDINSLSHAVPHGRHVAGVVQTEEGLVLIHDLAGFLTQAESESVAAALHREESARR